MTDPVKRAHSSTHLPVPRPMHQAPMGLASANGTRGAEQKDVRHTGGILWMTGLPGAGKTTLSVQLDIELRARGYRTFVLDGDVLRKTLNADLGYSEADRRENIRRAGEVAALFAGTGTIVIAAFISPYREDRDRLRARQGGLFHEIWLSTPLSFCEARDPKGMYARARKGELRDFTGVSAPYEDPRAPELALDTAQLGIEACISRLTDYVEARFRPS